MVLIFESILPVFLIVALGVVLGRWRVIPSGFWKDFNTFGFYVLFPCLMFQAIVFADFSDLPIDNIAYATLMSFGVMPIIIFAMWPTLKRKGLPRSTFTTLFQTTTRWHGFMALAIAEKLHGQTGLTFVAVVMVIIVLPINLTNVAVLVWFGDDKHSITNFAKKMLTNPIILASILAIIFKTFNIPIYDPIAQGIDFIARASLGMGLLMIGAGLRIYDLVHPDRLSVFAVLAKLILVPMAAFFAGTLFGLGPIELTLLTVACAVPTANNGYVLAQRMGGNAPLYASIASQQVILSFITIPVVLLIANHLTGQ
jgi:malonate transporter